MKFRVTKKDFIIFVIFAVLLLLLSSILVVNFYSLGNYGVFYGLNPFRGLLPPYLPVTLIVFIGSLIVIFVSASSYIFDKEKGKGIGLNFGEKEEKGYSRWSTEKEMKDGHGIAKVNPNDDVLDCAGVPIINNGKEIWCDNGDYHTLILGSTGCGKSESICKPTVKLLAKKGESMIVTDPKGELYKESAETLKERGYNVIVLNFREPENGNSWNPLALPYQYYKEGNKDKAIELLEDVASNILVDPKNPADSFWYTQAADFFSGIALGLFEDAKEEEVNFNSISATANGIDDRIGASNYIKEYFKLKNPTETACVFAKGTIDAPNDTKGSILSMFRNKIRIFATRDNLSEMLSYSDFDMRKIGEEKTAVFIVIHDEKTTYHSLATIFVKQCYECLVDIAQKNGGKLKYRTNFLLDEFANMPPLKDVDSMVSAARSRDIRFLFIIQNFAQLKDVYGDNVAEIIKGNCGNIIYLISTEMSALEEISKMCGEVKSKKDDKTVSTPLVSVTDLQKMKLGEAIYKRIRMNPFKTRLTMDRDTNWGLPKSISDYPTHKPHEVEIFDLKGFVDSHRQASGPMGGPMGGGNPFGGPNPFAGGNPFGGGGNPFAGHNPMMDDDGPFGGMPKPGPNRGPAPDFDQMMKDIEKRIKEIEEEEAKEEAAKASDNKQVIPEKQDNQIKNIDELNNFIDLPNPPKRPPINVYNEEKEITKDDVVNNDLLEKNDVKPTVNVDSDSVVVNENVITDDEFFDDFFGDDE